MPNHDNAGNRGAIRLGASIDLRWGGESEGTWHFVLEVRILAIRRSDRSDLNWTEEAQAS
ncbi:hypothetical protein Pla52o_40930 [Novipirellula galeiformis]|uniref:Uncharacterized protein n=1 Tax=Novipirellula galeiformis TaxID=2528004 RepID=A0A5C6CC83_9BACT|nr:hypothetical protein [Novipirellula galeiformis]TWU21061.1 hypothetical protein Pla52o_40930 [Novipirellula galeiformis]